MIELFVALIQFLIEVVVQAIISIPFDCSCRAWEKQQGEIFWFGFFFFVIGGMVGGVLSGLVPPLVHAPVPRVAGLFASPILAGVIGFKIAKWQSENRNPMIIPKHYFWYTLLFTLGLVSVRFVYAK